MGGGVAPIYVECRHRQRIRTEDSHDLRQAAVLLQATAAGVTEVLLLEPADRLARRGRWARRRLLRGWPERPADAAAMAESRRTRAA